MRPSSRFVLTRLAVRIALSGLPLLAGIATLSGCVVRAQPVVTSGDYADPAYGAPADATVYPTTAPPPPVAEYRPEPPGYDYVWVDGYWDW
jgi:hypothetical protein